MSPMDWHLGWWAPQPLAVEPPDLVDPHVHGPLLAAAADGAPLDALGQARLDALKAAGLATPKGRPRFPVARAEQAEALRTACADLGSGVARLLAGEWSRLEVEYEPIRTTVAGVGAPAVAFLGLAEGESHAVVGTWSARITTLPGRGHLIRFGRADAPHWGLAAVDPEAAPALPRAREPSILALCEGMGWSVVRLVADARVGLDPVRRRIPGADDEGAFRAWAYALAVDAALDNLSARGLLAPPIEGVVSIRVSDPALAGSRPARSSWPECCGQSLDGWPQLPEEPALDQVTDDVADGDVRFLDAGSIRGGDDHMVVGPARL